MPKKTILASFDVESLYSNTPQSLRIEAINFWIGQFPEELPEWFSKELVICSLRSILESNTFQFNDDFFRQKKDLYRQVFVMKKMLFTVDYSTLLYQIISVLKKAWSTLSILSVLS